MLAYLLLLLMMGFPICITKVSMKEDTGLYWSNHNHSCSCPARIKIKFPGRSMYVLDDSHTEKCVAKLKKTVEYAKPKEHMFIVVDNIKGQNYQ